MKKSMIKMGLVLTAIMFAVGLVGCPNDGGNPAPTPPAGQKNAFISRATIGAAQASFTPNMTSKLTEVVDASYQGDEDLQAASSAKTSQLVVTKASGSDKATVQMAVIKALTATPAFVKAAANTPATSSAPATSRFNAPSGGFANGDFVLLKVTSQDGSKVNYYRANVSLGLNATLESVTIGFTPQITETWLGKPAATLTSVEEGAFRTDPITNKSIFRITPVDDEATVDYAFVDTEPSTDPSPLKAFAEFEDGVLWSTIDTPTTQVKEGDYLFIKVTPSDSSGTPLIYVMKIEFPMVGSVKYGTPQLFDPANPGSAWYEDPIWGTEWTYDISRFNAAEDYPLWFKTEWGQHTVAKAKVLWDEDGIWALVDVTFNRYSTTETGEKVDRRITTPAEHEGDSFELFINERFQILDNTTHKDIGDQYRVGTLNQRTGRGAGFAPATDISDFTTAGTTGFGYTKSRTVFKKDDGSYGANLEDATNGGYKVIVQAPFKYKTSTDASDVFENGVVKPNAQIGLELQLNTGAGDDEYKITARDGILTWNGVNTQAYSNAAGYGVVTLEPKPASAPSVDVFPKITARTLNQKSYLPSTVAASVEELKVTATGGTPAYQWYVGTGPVGAGVPATGTGNATDTYKPVIGSTLKDEYYYAIITNGQTRVASARALIKTVGSLAIEDEWVINNPVLEVSGTGFTLNPDGSITATLISNSSSVIGYKFPTLAHTSFSKVVLEVEVSNIESGKKAQLASKNGYLVTSPDCTNPAYPEWSTASTQELTYNIAYSAETAVNSASLTDGAVSWQMNHWGGDSGTFTLKVNKATFTIADISSGPFYLNLANIPTTQGSDTSQWNDTLATPALDVGNKVTFTFDTTGATGNATRQRAIISLTAGQKEVLDKVAANGAISVEVGGSSTLTGGDINGTACAWRGGFIIDPTTTSNWNTSSLVFINNTDYADGKVTLSLTRNTNGATEGTGGFTFIAPSTAGPVGTLVVEYIKVTPPAAP